MNLIWQWKRTKQQITTNIPIRKPSKTKTFHDAASSKVNEAISNEVNQLSTDTDTNETHDQIQDDEGQRQTT